MSKVNYRKCDICGAVLKKDVRVFGFINGYRIWNRLFNKLDICHSCMKRLSNFLLMLKTKKNMLMNCFDNHDRYEDFDYESAYLQGAEDMLGILSHKRLRTIKIKK